MESKLITAIATVLEIDNGILLCDSFTDLGGDGDTADELVICCSKMGMTLTRRDILRCRTIAELQTCLRPTGHASPPYLQTKESDISSLLSETFSIGLNRSSNASNTSNSPSRTSSSITADDMLLTEELLTSTSQVPRATLLRPRAGFFEGKLVAFLTLVDISAPENSGPGDIVLIPHHHHHYAGSQVAALQYLLQNTTTITAIPAAWIVLEKMPLTPSGVCNKRQLQTWIQDMNEDLYKQVKSLENQHLLQEPSTDMERLLQYLISAVLKTPTDRIGLNFSFQELGGDEFSASELVNACNLEGVLLTIDDVAQSDSITHLAFLASCNLDTLPKWEGDRSTATFGLSPIQQLYFRTDVCGDYKARVTQPWDYRFNQSTLLKINTQISLDDIRAAIEAIVGHHSMLRARFQYSDGTWTQSTLADVSSSYVFGRHLVEVNDQVTDIIQQSQSSINIEAGPVFAAELIYTLDDQHMLYLVAHHLVIDLISWRVIIHDLIELLQNGSLYSERPMPFQKWIELQEGEINSLEHSSDLSFDPAPRDFAFWGVHNSHNTYGDTEEVSFALAPEISYILQATCNKAFDTDSTDIFLTTLLLSFCQTFPERIPPVIWNQEHGRDPWSPDVDIAETVGWFTTLCPLWLDTDSSEDFINVLRRMKDTRRAIPRQGWAYFASRFLPEAEKFKSHDWPCEIMFTYGGSFQQLEAENDILKQIPIPGLAFGSEMLDAGSRVGRFALFEVSTMIDERGAKIKFLYNRESRHQDRIVAWVSSFEHLLFDAIRRLRYHAQELTLADVPLLNIDYESLAKLNGDRVLALDIESARDIENVYPVTALQQDILMSQSKSPGSCHNHAIFKFSPAPGTSVDSEKICRAWQQTVAKYPSLRTVFIESVTDDGLFDQVVLRKCSPTMLFIDVGLTDDAVTILNKLPPLQCLPSEPRHRLSVCGTQKATFLKLEVSQAICDGASLGKVAGELKRAYDCNDASACNLELSYPRYIQSFKEARLGSKVDFWIFHLRGFKPRPFPVLSTAGHGKPLVTRFRLDIPVTDLDTYGRRLDIKRMTILRLAWGLVLRSYTGSNHICFGYRHTGRDLHNAPAGIDTAVGSFETTMISLLDLSSSKSLESVTQAIENQHSLYIPHQFTSVSEIQHALGMAGIQLFNTCFSFYDENRGFKSRFNSTKSQNQLRCVMYYNTLDQDISVSVMVNGGMLDVTLSHRILTAVQAKNVADTFACAVQAIIKSPNGSVGSVNLVSDRDYAQLAPAIVQKFKPLLAVHDIVELTAKNDPDALAVASWDGRLRYGQLSRRVSHVAHHLIELGVEPGSTIPLILGKSMWSSVAILAVLRAGGCFVPLDEEDTFFTQRIVNQLNSTVVLATDINAGKYFDLKGANLVVVNGTLSSEQPLKRREVLAVRGGDAACMMFRPSSTRSKWASGFFFTHEALSAAFIAQGPALGINVTSRVLQLSAFSSDTALAEILTTLVHGGCVCVPGTPERTNNLAGAIQKLEANWMYVTPVLARRLLPSMVPTIQTICFRTRRLDPDTLARWSAKTCVLLSYGTSEICPLGISVAAVSVPDQLSRIAPPFIGKFRIINPEDDRRLMPVGAIGELVIESPTLAHKLMRNSTPKKTLLALSQTSDKPFFKTGHRVRYMNDKTLEFITSCRDDVELNGHVIPVPTVERHIRQCIVAQSEVVVDVIRAKEGTDILTAFVELGSNFDGNDDLASLSATTRERIFIVKKLVELHFHTVLPSYMLPAAFIPLRILPLTSSLKVHRQKLQKMAGNLTVSALLSLATVADPEAIRIPNIKPLPLTQLEERMRRIWARLLNVDPNTISGSQSFIRLGGSAHLVANLVVTCRREGLLVPLGAVLQNTSLTKLCQSIALAEASFVPMIPESTSPVKGSSTVKYVITTVAPEVGIEVSPIVDAALATTAQIRSLEFALRTSHGGVNHLVLNFAGVVSSKQLEVACRGLVKWHPILSTYFVTYSRKVYQVVTDSRADFSHVRARSWRLSTVIKKMLKKDKLSHFVMEKPMTKFTFVDGGKQSALVIRLSTAQYDDSSLQVILQDLKRLYANGPEGLSRLPCLPFADFARSATESRSSALQHWTALLRGAAITRVISHTRPPKPASTPRTLTLLVPVTELGIAFDTVLKAAWSIVLARLSSTSDVTFGEVIDSRERVPRAVSGVAGPLHNTIPVRIRFDLKGTPLELLRYVHEQRLASLPHENLGMCDIVEKCTPWPYWSRFSTVVQHRYREGLGDAAMLSFGGTACTVYMMESAAENVTDLFVSSMQSTPEQSFISISFCESRISVSFVESVLDMLVSTIKSLFSSLHDVIIPSAEDISSGEQQIPLPEVDIQAPAHPQPGPELQEVVNKAWNELLDPRAHGVPEERMLTANFYDLCSSLIPGYILAARLTRDLAHRKVFISMEEVIDNPTQQAQLALIAQKIHAEDKSQRWKSTRLYSAVSPTAEDSDFALRRRASKAFRRMSRYSFLQPKTAPL